MEGSQPGDLECRWWLGVALAVALAGTCLGLTGVGSGAAGWAVLADGTNPRPGQEPRPTTTAAPNLPDLQVHVSRWGYRYPDDCADFGPVVVDVATWNVGGAAAGPFWLELAGERIRVGGLEAQSTHLTTISMDDFAPYLAVDPENEVVEVLEWNNVDRNDLGPFAAGATVPGVMPRRIAEPQRTEPIRCTHTPTPPAGPTQTPRPSPTPPPASWALTDPYFADVLLSRDCPTGQRLIQPCLTWRGPRPGAAVRVVSEPRGLSWDIDLAVAACGWPQPVPAGLLALRIDPDDTLRERAEANNRRAVPPPDADPPSLCTATPSATFTVSPTRTASPTRTPTPTRTPWPSRTHSPTPTAPRVWLPRLEVVP